MAQARLREALNAGGPGTKEKGPPVADGLLSITPDTPEAIEFRTRRSIFDSVGASSSYLEDETGSKPSELYGKFTWKIENFSEIGKRELRSTVFEVGSYKWYILVYPQGCDVCNHLSLFLCVADYDKLLPGWSHFAQFTIAVVNKDPKKSKYSDTLHRFCKKEHDWGWKKFMELNKVLEGFTVNNTLVIKAQVQVIRDRPSMPFRCLDAQYRRELVRVYLTNVETICRKFVEEKREALGLLRDDSNGFRQFWNALDAKKRRSLAQEKGEVILKGVVKRFFNEKEVTSTLVMDALFSGCKQLEEYGRISEQKKGKRAVSGPSVVINAEKNVFTLMGDMMGLLERAAMETIPPFRDDKAADALTSRNAQDTDDYSKDFIERDERRLADLGRRAVEMFAVSHVFKRLQESHSEAESIKRQDALIKEEEEAERLEDQRQAARTAADRERKARKKERRRAKKEEDDAKRAAEEAERKQQENEARLAQQEATERRKKEEKERLAVAAAAAAPQAGRQDSGEAVSRQSSQALSAGRAQRSALAPLAALARPASTTSLASNNNAAARGGEAETTGRADSEDEPPKTSRRAADDMAATRSGADASDADDDDDEDEELTSSTSPSNTDEAIGSYRPLRGHIEYLEGELVRSSSELSTTRSELATTKEALAEAQAEVASLRGELAATKVELASRPVHLTQRDSERAAAPPSAPSVASSYSAMNAVDVSSIISSLDGDSPSRAGSLDLSQDPSALRGVSTQDSAEAPSSGTSDAASVQTTGPPPPPPYNRRANWNGTPGSAQENHVGGSHHQGHASAANVANNARSKSGQLAAGRQPPPPPPPTEQRAGAPARGAAMSRQASAPAPKEGNSAGSRSQARAASLQPGQAGNDNLAGGSKRVGHHQHQQHESSRLGKNKPMLNGNAPSFVPQTSGAPPTANGTQGAQPNGHHPFSYRNVAAGLVISTSGSNDSSELPTATSTVPNGNGSQGQQGPPLPPQVSTGRGGAAARAPGSAAGSAASIPPTPRSLTLEAPAGNSPVAMNGNGEGSFSPTSYGMAHGQHAMQFSSPVQAKKAEQGGPAESPGLDDFAHMGLITDLLE